MGGIDNESPNGAKDMDIALNARDETGELAPGRDEHDAAVGNVVKEHPQHVGDRHTRRGLEHVSAALGRFLGRLRR